ncbi:DUF5634 family protein [Bacillus thuringiensis]|uniref:DUF5634 family protein n=1 Tax=Bacillus thuringiensis TaxID=1428 RepID=UPI0026E3E3F1|nr:DUF5634 family protein [Bacillus thuringiensis]MDO6659218.1 DUF5634 family protein [Bacillus thuringiensis]MDO6698800.1 DUF5634 family protein [Bacillus thuringiensis]
MKKNNFMRLTDILDGLIERIEFLNEKLGMQIVSCFENDGKNSRIGYTINTISGLCHVTMLYKRNDFGDYAILEDDWTVEYIENGNTQGGFKTIEDTVNYILTKELEKKVITGWLGGDYDTLGIFDSQLDAERGIFPTKTLSELVEEFKGKKVKITIAVDID